MYDIVKIANKRVNLYLCICTFAVDISQAQESKVNSSIGKTVLLPCYSSINDQYTNFTWTKNNSVLIMGTADKFDSDAHVKIYRNRIQLPQNSSSQNLSLTISDLKLEDMGMYRCETHSKKQTVKYKEIFLTITKGKMGEGILLIVSQAVFASYFLFVLQVKSVLQMFKRKVCFLVLVLCFLL
uniref:Ig-like domain-containing protein n=1 Tax=Callorhinchus milii TaxID=7868 RepID=A0A4W3HVA7_CALMI